MSTRASNARHVRQRKLNTKQALPIIREEEIEDVGEHDGQQQQNIPQFETGVEKGEEVVSPSQLTCLVGRRLTRTCSRNSICKP